MRFRTLIVAAVAAASTAVPLAGTANAYHCYSDVIGDCSVVQHALEDFKGSFKQTMCEIRSNVTGETCS